MSARWACSCASWAPRWAYWRARLWVVVAEGGGRVDIVGWWDGVGMGFGEVWWGEGRVVGGGRWGSREGWRRDGVRDGGLMVFCSVGMVEVSRLEVEDGRIVGVGCKHGVVDVLVQVKTARSRSRVYDVRLFAVRGMGYGTTFCAFVPGSVVPRGNYGRKEVQSILRLITLGKSLVVKALMITSILLRLR